MKKITTKYYAKLLNNVAMNQSRDTPHVIAKPVWKEALDIIKLQCKQFLVKRIIKTVETFNKTVSIYED